MPIFLRSSPKASMAACEKPEKVTGVAIGTMAWPTKGASCGLLIAARGPTCAAEVRARRLADERVEAQRAGRRARLLFAALLDDLNHVADGLYAGDGLFL